MATRTFLTPEQVEDFLKNHRPEASPSADVSKSLWSRSPGMWMSERADARLTRHPHWAESKPIIVGSWARGELTPKSDLDLVCSGDSVVVEELARSLSREGLKVRARQAEEDWFAGVDLFDQASLLHGRAGTEAIEAEFQSQIQAFRVSQPRFRQALLKRISIERRERIQRHNTIANYLEPNIKFGRGGLRDIYQGMLIAEFFPERISQDNHAIEVFRHYRELWIGLRCWLHLQEGGSDVFHAGLQADAAQWFGMPNVREFMREIQKGLSRVSFYWNWTIAQASSSVKTIRRLDAIPLRKVSDLARNLKREPDILMLNRIRIEQPELWKKETASSAKKRGQELEALIAAQADEMPLIGAFESRWIDFVIPEFLRITGHVQHDQYHRFTVDAHLLNILLAFKRIYRKPSLLLALKKMGSELRPEDWRILVWSGLYHDLAKGRSGDHSVEGSELVARDFTQFGFKRDFISEVQWMVENHLVLSQAAFRMNPASPVTWKYLEDHGVEGRRGVRLAIFTAADIMATNPEAWNQWKSELLARVQVTYQNERVSLLLDLAAQLEKKKFPLPVAGWLEQFDPYFLDSVVKDRKTVRTLAEDISACLKRKTPSVKALRRSRRATWVRFHAQDEAGLFLKYVNALTRAGLSIRHASVITDSHLGVYDWFEVSEGSTKRLQTSKLEALLDPAQGRGVATNFGSGAKQSIRFEDIQVVTPSEHEWIVRFRGRDQRGALLSAASALFQCDAEIRWAKVHTWGRQIDDVFGIKPPSLGVIEPSQLSEKLKRVCLGT